MYGNITVPEVAYDTEIDDYVVSKPVSLTCVTRHAFHYDSHTHKYTSLIYKSTVVQEMKSKDSFDRI